MMKSRNFIATPPGATIREQLVDRGMSQKEFASRMEMSEKHISKLINGNVALTQDVANRLEMVLGLPAHFWNNLESIYREKILKVEEENQMDEDKILVKKFPYKEMSNNEWINDTSKLEEKVKNLRTFFEVVRLGLLKDDLIPGIACRRQSITEKADYALISWAQKAKIESRYIETSPINVEALSKNLLNIRKMTTYDPADFCPKLVSNLSKCGIALVFLPHIGGSFLHGATFYDANKIVLGLTVRGKDADRFWFSLFHELGHILLGHINNPDGTTENDEKEADAFASELLIPNKDYKSFVNKNDFSRRNIIKFAKSIDVDPGIVVGRLQKDGYIQYSWYHNLKKQYVIY